MSASPRCSTASSGRRIAIVHDQPGVTRDRVTAEAEWRGRPFTLVDTGGIGLLRREKADDVIVKAAMEQVELAIEAANVIILVVNVQEGVVPLDREAAARLRRSGKPVLVAVNKVDTHRAEDRRAGILRARLRENLSRQRDSRRRHRASDGCGDGDCCQRQKSAVRVRQAEAADPTARRLPLTDRGPAAETRHRRPPERRQVLHHQRPHAIRTRHRQPDSRHHPRRGGRAVRGRDRGACAQNLRAD